MLPWLPVTSERIMRFTTRSQPWRREAIAIGVSLLLFACAEARAPQAASNTAATAARERSASIYRFGRATRDGIGKYYQGREIAQVMGHLGAAWLERRSRRREERTDLLIDRLPLEPDFHVADIGAGTGYFTFPVAQRVPEGKVYAVDIQPEMLAMIRQRATTDSVANVELVLGREDSTELPANTIDLAFIVDAYHEFSYPKEIGESIVTALKPNGRLVLVEYRGEDPMVPIKPLHKMTERQVKKELRALGLRWEATRDYLPQQHVLVFRKPASSEG